MHYNSDYNLSNKSTSYKYEMRSIQTHGLWVLQYFKCKPAAMRQWQIHEDGTEGNKQLLMHICVAIRT